MDGVVGDLVVSSYGVECYGGFVIGWTSCCLVLSEYHGGHVAACNRFLVDMLLLVLSCKYILVDILLLALSCKKS